MRQGYWSTHVKPTISVSLEEPRLYLDEGTPNIWKMFHCHVCGKPVFEYQTKARIIIAGDKGRETQALTRVQCKNDKTLYIIS